jgi:enolase-phosphatase E1
MTSIRRRLRLVDVEGTVAPISLVADELFPYARRNFPQFLKRSTGDPGVRADLSLLAQENRAEKAAGVPRLPEVVHPDQVETPRFRLDAMVYLTWLMDRDRKSTALKSLQGKVWKAGFENGQLKGTLFDDVLPAFQQWASEGAIAIYSSGSVEAQQLLFRHTNFGDLTPLLSGYFDTRTGPKSESASYRAIAEQLAVSPDDVTFFSDVVGELDAAREAGCATRLVVRPGNNRVEDPHGHESIKALVELPRGS